MDIDGKWSYKVTHAEIRRLFGDQREYDGATEKLVLPHLLVIGLNVLCLCHTNLCGSRVRPRLRYGTDETR